MDKLLEELKKFKDVYYDTEEVELGDKLKVLLKVISSEEETEAHTFALQYEQGLSYIYSVKRETVARSIIKLGDNDIPEFIKVGEETIQRHVWLRDNIFTGWNQMVIDKIWVGYSNLLNRLELNIGGDIVTEIEEEGLTEKDGTESV